MTDWSKPRPEPVRPIGLTIYCAPPAVHEVCPGYSTVATNETLNHVPAVCGCSCHEEPK